MSIMSVWRWFSSLIRWLLDLVSDPGNGGGETTTLYGCPNSNRTEKLQLKKQLYKS